MTIRTNTVRIISGKWKGRKLVVAPIKNLRPTPDRARETIFNWIAPDVSGSNVLDLFAGTGVLGFEALSRGARHANFIELNKKLVGLLKRTATELEANCTVQKNKASNFLRKTQDNWDIVFLDPPFSEPFHYSETLQLLKYHLNNESLVYVEHPNEIQLDLNDYQLWKQSKIGNICCKLLRPKQLGSKHSH